MKRISKNNKHAFTLVEVMTAVAIICLIGGIFVSLVVSINESFKRTYSSNDAADYAYLYSTALENYIIKTAETDPGKRHTFEIDTDNGSAFLIDGTAPFDFKQIKDADGNVKWRVYLKAKDEGNGLISYTLYFVDNYAHPDILTLEYSGAFWIPAHGTTQPAVPVEVVAENAVYDWNGVPSSLSGVKSDVIYINPTAGGETT